MAKLPDAAASRLQGLPPVLSDRTRVLILGSFPSAASLAAGQYYAHPQNQFWRLLEAALGLPLAATEYAARCQAVLSAGAGIWDIYESCRRPGSSLDAAIREPVLNDFAQVLVHAPKLRRVCFNGKTAARIASAWSRFGVDVAILPSSSPAYTLAFEQKAARWREAFQGLHDVAKGTD